MYIYSYQILWSVPVKRAISFPALSESVWGGDACLENAWLSHLAIDNNISYFRFDLWLLTHMKKWCVAKCLYKLDRSMIFFTYHVLGSIFGNLSDKPGSPIGTTLNSLEMNEFRLIPSFNMESCDVQSRMAFGQCFSFIVLMCLDRSQ